MVEKNINIAENQNRDVINRISNDLKISPLSRGMPKRLASSIVPVLNVNPDRVITLVESGASTSGNNTIYTASNDSDTYITTVYLILSKDAASDATIINFNVRINGALKQILRFFPQTLVAVDQVISLSLPMPLKIDKGSTVILAHTGTVGTTQVAGGFTGYEVNRF